MIIRRYTKQDIPELIIHLREGLVHFHYGSVLFDEAKVQWFLGGNLGSKLFFLDVATTDDGEIIGALCASVCSYVFSYEAFAQDHVTYIRPGVRSLKVITGLVASYVAWSKAMKVHEIRWSQSSGYKMDKFPKLAARLGFKQIGSLFQMELNT